MLGWCPARSQAARTWRRYSEPSSSLASWAAVAAQPSSSSASPKVTVLPPRPWTPVRGGRCARLPQPLTAQPGRAPCTFTCKLKAPPSRWPPPWASRGAEHLLIALLDQGTPEVTQTLSRAGLDAAAVRQAALAVIGAAADQPPIPLPALAPAGTMDRPPLPFADLDARAWAALRWRQDHLPLSRLRRDTDWQALTHLERTAAWRLTARLGLDDDQRYSLICHHSDEVERRAAQGRPDLARRRIPGRAAASMAIARGRRRHRFLALTVGWATWFDNRRVGLRDRWFRLRTIRHYRGSPQP